ncbi:MAG TPA: protein-tyrosine phosphatase family protein [Blastocatellia bacterium]|nr:protein-tyrosine phosphatase family protein [Blastocatellia bacterium]
MRYPYPARARRTRERAELITRLSNQSVFVHCRGGRHRTGVMTAVYRMSRESWTARQAYDEMKRYEFEKGFGHGELKNYVYDYYARIGVGQGTGRGISVSAPITINAPHN